MNKKLWILLLFVSVFCILYFFTDVKSYLNLEFLLAQREFFLNNLLVGVVILLFLYFVLSFFYLPIAFLSIFSGFLLGFLKGSVVVYVGAMINIIFSFIWARYLFRDYFTKVREKKESLNKISSYLESNGKIFVFFARVFFVTPYNLLNIICGISAMSFRDYTLYSAGGAILQAFFYSYVGSKITDMALTDNLTSDALSVALSMVVFFGFIALGKKMFIKYFVTKKQFLE